MDQVEFRAQLQRDGFDEIETRSIAPSLYNPAHSHEHTEWFGPEGATYLVGRKHPVVEKSAKG